MGGFVDCMLDVITNAWYEVLFKSQFDTDIDLYDYFTRSGIDTDVEVFKRGGKWRLLGNGYVVHYKGGG